MQIKDVDRIVYYSENDLAFGFQYSKITKHISEITSEAHDLNLTDVLELIEINKYLNSSIIPDKKPEIVKNNNQLVGRWLSEHTNRLLDEIQKINLPPEYEDSLWKQIVKLYVKSALTNEIIARIINLYKGTRILYPLRQAKIVKDFGALCCEILVQTPDNVLIVLGANSNRAHLPKEFTPGVRSKFFMNYISSDKPNPKYLEQIQFDKLASSDVRIMAKTIYDRQVQTYFANNSDTALKTEIIVKIDPSMKSDVNVESSLSTHGQSIRQTLRYNGRMLDELMDWPSILNSFIYMFGMTDRFGILSVTPRTEQESFFERFFRNDKTDQYQYVTTLAGLITPYQLSFTAYYEYLQSKGIRLENVLEWFFDKYLGTNFNIHGLSIDLPKETDRDEIKTLIAITQLHRIVRMYSNLAYDPDFDRQLIDTFSNTPHFSEIPSIVSMKYGSISNAAIKDAEFYLFSDQAVMPSSEELRFGDMVAKNISEKDSLDDLQLNNLEKLQKSGVLKCENNKIQFAAADSYQILKEDFETDVIPYSRIITYSRHHEMLDEMKSKGELNSISTLLTKREALVFDYYFSDLFSNGKGIRNMYAHGAYTNLTKKQHRETYMISLMFIVFLVIKINDDLDEWSQADRDDFEM